MSWNVNGLRAVVKKDFLKFLQAENPDILGIQETKIQLEQIPEEVRSIQKYQTDWSFAEKKGYSGTGVFYKPEPLNIKSSNFDSPILEQEGRIIEMEYKNFVLFNIYFPNGQMSEERLQYKLEFYEESLKYFNTLRNKGKKLIISGDFNTAHKEIDLKNPKSNEDRSGFLPVERFWMDKLVSSGFVDTFRMFNEKPDQYTWWTYRFKAREKNIGWRIDYFFVSDNLVNNVVESTILPEVQGSDHCPIRLKIKI